MNKKKISVIMPVHNGKEYLEKLLPSVVSQNYKDYEVIIVNDASPDKTIIPYIKEKYPDFTILENDKNIGFACSVNAGIRASKGKYICVLNSDTLLDESYIKEHVDFLEKNNNIGILGCKVLNEDGSIQSSGVIFKDGYPHFFTDDIPELRYVEHVDFVGVFVRRELFEIFGLMSPDYFMKFDDCDFCLRVARASNKYKFALLPKPLITHFGRSNSMNCFDNTFYYCRSLIIFQKKFFPEEVNNSVIKHIPETFLSRLKDGFKNPRIMPAIVKIILSGIKGIISGLKFNAKNSKDYLEKLQ